MIDNIITDSIPTILFYHARRFVSTNGSFFLMEEVMKKSNPILKTDTAQNWEKAVNFIPSEMEIIAY